VSLVVDMNQEMGVSQLSAMFDGELPAAECELLSRRLGRDEQLRGRWARYSVIGAALRSEPVAKVSGDFSRRVGAAIDVGSAGVAGNAGGSTRNVAATLRKFAMGSALVAGVAGAGIFVLRSQMLLGDPALTAYIPSVQRLAMPVAVASVVPTRFARVTAAASFASHEPLSYIVPPATGGASVALPASLANYIVAHSEYSSPLVRSGLISSLVAGDGSVSAVAPDADGEVIIAADDSR
jgi:sigma-E factor negative regulatory protein RseA